MELPSKKVPTIILVRKPVSTLEAAAAEEEAVVAVVAAVAAVVEEEVVAVAAVPTENSMSACPLPRTHTGKFENYDYVCIHTSRLANLMFLFFSYQLRDILGNRERTGSICGTRRKLWRRHYIQ
jgi:acetylglutamate synthase